MMSSDLSDTNLQGSDFSNAYLMFGSLRKADASSTDFTDASLIHANISRTNFSAADLTNADLSSVTAIEADFQVARFTEAQVSEADFTGSILTDADFTDASAHSTTFEDVNAEDATFVRTELRDATLQGARLYQTVFSEVRINVNTEFGQKSIYQNPEMEFEQERTVWITDFKQRYDDTSRWEAAAWVYRRLRNLHEDNAMSERARDYHVRKEEAHRAEYRENGEWFQWSVYTLNRYLTKHGESLKHVVAWAIGIIVVCGLLYPFTGGLVTTNGTEQITAVSDLSPGVFARSFYYSMVTFTTLGYGTPAGTGAKLLVGLESLAGTLLVALFVFVLGRRVAR